MRALYWILAQIIYVVAFWNLIIVDGYVNTRTMIFFVAGYITIKLLNDKIGSKK